MITQAKDAFLQFFPLVQICDGGEMKIDTKLYKLFVILDYFEINDLIRLPSCRKIDFYKMCFNICHVLLESCISYHMVNILPNFVVALKL